ncbi:bestrophin family protein [Aliirhizobium cellulosilyticum]|uniref:Putative membrane protein n=1 Tax=Aliirhizobium cellulosilyticum TaxID=393664 RepID=A0A7W6TF51_9HYPH|nr:bestrophin family protein [Rhizobium cellulosilyticum]MBB4349412.1 putative membrane protein [Rhizobium cellulosilyticum]MBB4412366.1 putative membrane protein [Rhizobium cellulosilyticum]MBB4446998.1 putative membrane protein [Rhizobium cellulosilyticum]
MIVREKPNLLRLFFIVQGSIVPRVLPHLIFITVLSITIVFAREHWPAKTFKFDGAPFSLVGIALSIFLGFRNSACYDRWWEGRRCWGQLVTSSRTLARQTLFIERLGPEASGSRSRVLKNCYVFAHSLVSRLRPDSGYSTTASGATKEPEPSKSASGLEPDQILTSIMDEFTELRVRKLISDHDFQMFDATLREMTQMQVACERLKNTPLPFGYTLLLHRTAYAFCFLIPFGFADTLGWGTPIVTALIAYTFFGLDALGDELEDPFGHHPNTLAIGAIATTIEIEMRRAVGETNLPSAPQPRDHILV